jgi:hypothetical protein
MDREPEYRKARRGQPTLDSVCIALPRTAGERQKTKEVMRGELIADLHDLWMETKPKKEK